MKGCKAFRVMIVQSQVYSQQGSAFAEYVAILMLLQSLYWEVDFVGLQNH